MNKNTILYAILAMLYFMLFSCSQEELILPDPTPLDAYKRQSTQLGIDREKININTEDASIVAEIFNRKNHHLTRNSLNEPTKRIKEIFTLYNNGKPMMYIINYQDRSLSETLCPKYPVRPLTQSKDLL